LIFLKKKPCKDILLVLGTFPKAFFQRQLPKCSIS